MTIYFPVSYARILTESVMTFNVRSKFIMAKNTGKGYRKGSVDNRTQVENPKTDEFVKRNQDPNSEHEGEFMDVKEDGEKFKGVAEEPDKRRKK